MSVPKVNMQNPPVSTGGTLNTIKTKNMPLTPKQEPPYYETGETNPTNAVQRIATQTTVVPTSGTSETTVQTITIPANTLTQNGDIITMNYWGNSTNLPSSAQVSVTAFGTALGSHGWINNYKWQLKVNLMRVTSSIVYYTSQLILNAGTPQLIESSITSINFTIEQTITLTIQAAVDGNVQCNAGYTQQLKA